MKTRLEESLIDCLSWCGVLDLPKKDSGEDVWIKAIAKVAKRDSTHAYVAMVKDNDGENKVVRDFGSCASIAFVEEIYPYLYLDAKYVPVFKSKTDKKERVDWLKYQGGEKDYESMTLKQLDKEVLVCAMMNHLKVSNNFE